MNTEILRSIHDLFRAEGFNVSPHTEPVEGQRRELIESYYAGINWDSPQEMQRVLRILQVLLSRMERAGAHDAKAELLDHLRHDGFELDVHQRLHPVADPLVPVSAADLTNGAALSLHTERMRRAALTDPEAAIGSAKELVESALKYALEELGTKPSGKEDLPELVKAVQSALNLHAGSVAPTAPGADSIKRVLGGLSTVAIGIAELRNQYGTGHGRARAVSGLSERHALLAVNSASTYVDFLLRTLNDPHAPWRSSI